MKKFFSIKSNRLLKAAVLTSIFATGFYGSTEAAPHGDSPKGADVIEGRSIVVTANRTKALDLDSPASTVVITGKELTDRGENSLFEVVSRVAGVTTFSYGTGGEDYVSHPLRVNVRGIDKGTLILLNGSPINVQAQNSALSAIPVDAVERIEIVRGSNSVLYGAEAMGGIINVITKKPKKMERKVGVEIGNKEKNYSLSVGDDNWNLRYRKEYRAGVDPFNRVAQKGANYRISTKDKSRKDSILLDYALSDKLTFHYIYNDIESGFASWQIPSLSDIYSNRALETRYRQSRKQHDANLIYLDKAKAFKVSFNYLNDTMDFTKYAKNKRGKWGYTPTSETGNVYHLDVQKNWWLDDTSHLIAGTDWHREDYDKKSVGTDTQLTRDQYALFLSYEKNFKDKFAVTLGAREHFVKKNAFERGQNIFLPQLQMKYKLDHTSSLYTNIGKSFVMPSIANSPVYTSTINPQTGWSYELGYKHITKRDGFRAALFHMDIKDKFEWVKENNLIPGGDPGKSVLINRSQFRNTGLELEYTRKLNDVLRMRYSASLSSPESKDEGQHWSQDTSRFQAGVDLTYEKERFLANLNCFYLADREAAYYRHDGSYASKNGVDHHLDNSLQLNMNFRYRATDCDTITLGVYNVLDRENPINKYEYPAMPRNFRLGYSHTF